MLKLIIVISTVALFIMPISAINAQTTNPTKLQNCTWLLPSSEGLQLMNESPSMWKSTAIRLEKVNINCIIVWAGTWNADHTINYADSPTTWAQFISTVKGVNPDFMVLALVGTGGIDISDSNYRATMLNSVEQLLTSAPFDGWNDDLESFIGSNQNLIDYWQSVASLVKDMGKIATVDVGVDWSYKIEDVYSYLTNFDYIIPMFYWTIKDANALSYWDRILSNSPVPVIMGLDVDQNEMKNFPLAQQLSWIDQALNSSQHSNLAGFSIWAYDYWDNSGGTSNDFLAWANWVSTPTQAPTPPPTATIFPTPTQTQTPTSTPIPTSTTISTQTPTQQTQPPLSIPAEYITVTAIAVIVPVAIAAIVLMKRKK